MVVLHLDVLVNDETQGYGSNGNTPAAITLTQIDANTNAVTGSATVDLPPQSRISLSFPGYGLALLAITPA